MDDRNDVFCDKFLLSRGRGRSFLASLFVYFLMKKDEFNSLLKLHVKTGVIPLRTKGNMTGIAKNATKTQSRLI